MRHKRRGCTHHAHQQNNATPFTSRWRNATRWNLSPPAQSLSLFPPFSTHHLHSLPQLRIRSPHGMHGLTPNALGKAWAYQAVPCETARIDRFSSGRYAHFISTPLFYSRLLYSFNSLLRYINAVAARMAAVGAKCANPILYFHLLVRMSSAAFWRGRISGD